MTKSSTKQKEKDLSKVKLKPKTVKKEDAEVVEDFVEEPQVDAKNEADVVEEFSPTKSCPYTLTKYC